MMMNIIIPVLNEESTLIDKVHTVITYLDGTDLKGNYRITIIDNGSDDSTPKLARKLTAEFDNKVFYIRLEERGVGLAFRNGIRQNTCDIVGYMDLDLATDLKHLLQVYNAFVVQNENIVVGSRLLKDSEVIGRKMIRNITSVGLNTILKIYLNVGFSDAMCGFKFYKKSVADQLVSECSDSNGWFYCAEMLIRAEWIGLSICELPVKWTDDPNSKVKIGKLSMSYLKEIQKLHKEKRKYKS